MKKKSILVLAPSIPFSRGGAELLTEKLISSFNKLGHEADLFSIPFFPEPKTKLIEQAALWRAQDLSFVSGRKIDMVIPLKFPSYYVKHDCKIPWLLHQHRQAYELVGTKYGDFGAVDESIRSAIIRGDNTALSESKEIYTISENVTARLLDFNKLQSKVLHPPLPWDKKFKTGIKGDYILYVGRLCTPKRVDLIIEALPKISHNLKLVIVGRPDEPGYKDYLNTLINKHQIANERISFLEGISEEALLDLYANCFSVYYGPFDEDYGFVTYEACGSAKPLVTLSDSGFVASEVKRIGSGIICEIEDIANTFNELLKNTELYESISKKSSTGVLLNDWNSIAETFIKHLL